jgi:hypothetical protein
LVHLGLGEALDQELALVAEELGVLDVVRRNLAETDVEHAHLAVTRSIADGRLVQAADVASRQEYPALGRRRQYVRYSTRRQKTDAVHPRIAAATPL